MCPKSVWPDLVQNLASECVCQYSAGLSFINTARSEVENGSFIQLANCRTVATLDIISVYLQLWFGVYLSVPRQKEVLVALF